jgi:hypothetical protein
MKKQYAGRKVTVAEPRVTINGVDLSVGQAMTLRVAMAQFLEDMSHPNALGTDEHGRRMTAAYREHARNISAMILRL